MTTVNILVYKQLTLYELKKAFYLAFVDYGNGFDSRTYKNSKRRKLEVNILKFLEIRKTSYKITKTILLSESIEY